VSFHFDAVFYYVSDLDRAVDFYTRILGFRLISRDVVARFDVDGVLFEIVPASDRRQFSGQGNARLCLRVEDIREAVEHLKRNSVSTTEPELKPGGVLSRFHDPDGNEICLWQYDKTRDE
jgi:catechol 2,3-dioxygenase-like lactoylglutathione lyase family enzyme